MALTIWKYPLDVKGVQLVDMPVDAKILSVQEQHDIPTVWALVDPVAPKVPFHFVIAGTGHPIEAAPIGGHEFLGTVQLRDGNRVYHVWWAS